MFFHEQHNRLSELQLESIFADLCCNEHRAKSPFSNGGSDRGNQVLRYGGKLDINLFRRPNALTFLGGTSNDVPLRNHLS